MWQERLNEFVTLFVVVNPIGALPVFLAVTGGLDAATSRRVALNAVIVAFVTLVFFMIAGGFLLERMGIALRAFQIAGGLVLFVFALHMIQGEFKPASDQRSAKAGALALAIYPLAIPKIAGPGTMLTVVLLADDDRFNFIELSRTTLVLAVVLVIQLAIFLAAQPISRVIGESGASVIGRIMGMLLAALAVNMVLTAVGDWLSLPKL